ncbi:RidA family protein [Saliniramus sp.]|uniref:RidA family protein n=1 Tax=Saliniramus sp. TaxID=2986772 RepID=UPI002D10AA1E|nr:RidA family protein [Saliniramus sp.]HMB11242.1 RidA family protein [Saliniramus sp.]
MPDFFNPPTIHAPASSYSHGATHALTGRRLVISGQIGVHPDGAVAKGVDAQLDLAWANLLTILRAADMEIRHLVKVTVFSTRPDTVMNFRAARDKALQGHAPATTYLQVAGLAAPDLLVEIEAEAVRDAD